MTSNAPQEPSADMRQMANFVRQMYVSLTNEGFSEKQALVIVGQIIAVGMAGGQK